jgi:putative transposase
MAIGARRPKAGLAYHTDRGRQCASRDYLLALHAADITCSMSSKGNCWDNVPAKSSFATPSFEEFRHCESNTREALRDKALRNFCWYNAHRRHSTLGLLSPATFEAQTRTATCAAGNLKPPVRCSCASPPGPAAKHANGLSRFH